VGRGLAFRKQFLAFLATMIAERVYLVRGALAFDGKPDGYAFI